MAARPDEEEGGRMHPGSAADSLSEALLNSLRVEGAVPALTSLSAGQGLRVDPDRRPTLHLVLAGRVTLTLPGGSPTDLSAGECALVFYGDRHVLGDPDRAIPFVLPSWQAQALPVDAGAACADGAVVLTLALTLSDLPASAFANRAAPGVWVVRPETSSMPLKLADAGQSLAALSGPGGVAVATMLGAFLFTVAMRAMSLAVWDGEMRDVRDPNVRRIAAIRRALRAGLEQDWTVDRMARSVGLSRSAFAEAFTAAVGMAPMAYLTQQRMERAALLLRSRRLSLQEVGRRVGYALESSFARTFKRHWGVPPRQFAEVENDLTGV
jgi:AraC-like DNA-binding protein/mannose-6-phosphate isomerase-like protein (cupin superfamily)